MKVEIWSDIMCPFCYIGKRRFEQALGQFSHKEEIEVVWKSFQLNPAMKTEPGKTITQYLADIKGWSLEQARAANQQVTNMAKEVGLDYRMDTAVVANSYDAHRLIQLAKTVGKGDDMEERLFKAYFTESKNIADHSVLTALGEEVGLDAAQVTEVLAGKGYADKVDTDVYEAQQIGVRGVPFFVLNDRYTVSGAQASETFAGALATAWTEYEQQKPSPIHIPGNDAASCTTDGDCN